MKKYWYRGVSASVVFLLALCFAARASEFRAYGPRAMSMGGAGVARPEGAFAVYYNPAALGSAGEGVNVNGCGRFGAKDTGIAEHLNSLTDMDWETATDNPQSAEAAAIIAEIESIAEGAGLVIVPGGALAVRVGSLGAAVYGEAQIVVYADLDTVHLNQTGLMDPRSFYYNTSALYAQGLALVELPIAYGRQFDIGNGSVSVGGAVKFIQGATYDVRENSLTAGTTDIEETLKNSDKTGSGFGVDLGAQYRSEGEALSVGLLARNINSPKFETATGAEFAEDIQVRIGVAYQFTENLYAAMDIDVTENETLIAGYKSRQIGAGVSYNLTKGISLRGGLMKNVGTAGTPIVLSLGASLGTERFHFDIAGTLAGTAWQKVEDLSIPTDGSIMMGLAANW